VYGCPPWATIEAYKPKFFQRMQKPKRSFVRACRRKSALTSNELARLIGQRSDSSISAYEAGDRLPTLRVALALEVIFGLSPKLLFPGTYVSIEEEVMMRAAKLYGRLQGREDRKSTIKQAALDAIAERAAGNSPGA
jgi:transcriptional regulator with XRE-family HTH domain